MNAHAHTGDCPVTCLKAMLSAQSYGLLRSECALICGDQDANIGHAVRLFQKGQLATVRYIGPRRLADIESCLASLGLITDTAEPADETAADAGPAPPVPAGWPGNEQGTGPPG
jgi:hypothetical protein